MNISVDFKNDSIAIDFHMAEIDLFEVDNFKSVMREVVDTMTYAKEKKKKSNKSKLSDFYIKEDNNLPEKLTDDEPFLSKE